MKRLISASSRATIEYNVYDTDPSYDGEIVQVFNDEQSAIDYCIEENCYSVEKQTMYNDGVTEAEFEDIFINPEYDY